MTDGIPSVKVRAVSRLFDDAVGFAGALIGTCAVIWFLQESRSDQHRYLLAIPLIVVLCWFPVRIGRSIGTFEIGFDICVLMFLVTRAEPLTALAIWAASQLLGQLVLGRRRQAMVFNTGIGVIAGAVAVLVIVHARGLSDTTVRELGAVGLGALLYFAVDFALTAVSIALEERSTLRAQLGQPDAVVALIAFLATASLGYLAAIVGRELPFWSAALVAIPVANILVAVRARARGVEQARRLTIVLAAATTTQELFETDFVLAAVLSGVREMLRDDTARVSSVAPGQAQVGAPIMETSVPTWLVGSAVPRVGATAADDQQGLTALARVAATALARLRLGAEVAHLAWHDPLTGLANRALFMDRLGHAVKIQERRNAGLDDDEGAGLGSRPTLQGQLAVLFCDLDGFKRVNDVCGHVAGDELLLEVARRITRSVREADTVARLGGDEFAVLLEGLVEPEEASHACERIVAAVRDSIHVGNTEVSVTVTVGVAIASPGQSAGDILRQADLAMYHAKAQGKDRWESYRSHMGEDRLQRLELVESLRRAIEAKELTLAYQTVHDLRTGAVYGIEALARWRRNGVDVPPDLFIPAAEESGLIVALGQLVLEIFTAEVPSLRVAIGRRVAVGFNVSAQQLQREEFASEVLQARELMTDVDLVLEVTERDFVNNDPRTLAAMNELAAADVRFAVDDFGIGFSSIGYLHQLPIRILKIDKSFVADIERDAKSCSLVRSMVVMGNALGLDVVAEGVERASQVDHLTDHAGATMGQGYLYRRPMPLTAMAANLASEPRTIRNLGRPVDVGQSRLAEDHALAAILDVPAIATGR